MNKINYFKLLLVPVIIFSITSCSGENMAENRTLYDKFDKVPAQNWQAVNKGRIYFGHHSVGNNILDGMRAVIGDHPAIDFTIAVGTDKDAFKRNALVHSPVGANKNPTSKIDAFAKYIENGLGNQCDVAFFKFCYIDFDATTDVDALFAQYRQTMDRLKQKYPRTTFVHVTVPLTVIQTGPKAWVKRIIGRPIRGYAENAARNRFNQLLINTYQNKMPIFDLAAAESTYPDGRRYSYEHEGQVYNALVPAYASDGKHLNADGGRHVAKELLLVLANVL